LHIQNAIEKREAIAGSYNFQKSRLILYNPETALKTKGGDSACPLPLPNPALCDSVLLFILGLSQLGAPQWRGQTEGEAPWNVMSWC
jgi:hypothetical protein